MDDKTRYLVGLYKNEMLHKEIYSRLAKIEKDKGLKMALLELSVMEAKHERLWGEILIINNVRLPKPTFRFSVMLALLLRRIVGLALSVKLIEYFEEGLEKKFEDTLKKVKLTGREAKIIKTIERDEVQHERPLEEEVISHGKLLANIRDVAFGLNDGLVELLAVIVGFAAAISNPLVILLAGFIVSISGTLSMAGGAYLSTEYEASVEKKGRRGGASKSAFYVGVMYFIGTLFPLAPFLFGLVGYAGIAVAIIVTALALTVSSSIIAVISDTSIARKVGKTLLISLGIDMITILIGVWARAMFNLPV